MKRLTIAVDARPATWSRTGIGTIAYNFLHWICRIDPNNTYLFYADRCCDALADIVDSESWRFAPIGSRVLWANSFVPRQAAKDKIDIFLSFLEKDVPLLGLKAKLVCMINDVIPLHFPETMFRNKLHEYYYRTLIRAAVRRADLILTDSEHARRDIVRYLGASEQKVRPVTLGVDTRVPQRDRDEVLERYGIRGDYILAIGATEPRKNNALVIEAFKSIAERIPNLSLVVVGKAWRGIQFPSRLLTGNVHIAGYVQDEDMPIVMSNAKCLVFPSLHEGFGLPVLEAMAYGVPVITSNSSALPEVGGDSVLYVNPNSREELENKMIHLLSNPTLAQELSIKGRIRATQFTWKDMCRQIVACYPELTA